MALKANFYLIFIFLIYSPYLYLLTIFDFSIYYNVLQYTFFFIQSKSYFVLYYYKINLKFLFL